MKKPLFERWWFFPIIIIIGLCTIENIGSDSTVQTGAGVTAKVSVPTVVEEVKP